MAVQDLTLAQLCGQLIVGGFAGTELPAGYRQELAAGHRAGAILFRHNLLQLEQILSLNREICAAAGNELPPLIGVDQEGGRVRRLPAPFLSLPPMRRLGSLDDVRLTGRAAACVAAELRAAGFSMCFAPVLDVDSNPANPVIGDRAFGSDTSTVIRHGLAFLWGLQEQGIAACGKHFPGHGDTSQDSHVELPYVDHAEVRLREVELKPFLIAAASGIASLMSAHVVFRALDPENPATLSARLCSQLLRLEAAYEGVLLSDDLEMGAVAKDVPIEEAACRAIMAGCDVLLICHDEERQARAHEALIRQAEQEPRFHRRCRQAAGRSLELRRTYAPTVEPAAAGEQIIGGAASQEVAEDIEQGRAQPTGYKTWR